ncbi:DNA-directed RNA polymerase II subunit RPB9 [Porphyridium purpureum]|uniref:DNA-directed RNA polymerase II subunit RPB9 n=1 Tax=Porphyridium purpureum TaxID=35688 RepID=A0A5J4YZ14_PORPP|nr:DNA-directed RNA polymerase II subunit RPB9 [Porphyridium purpureum]|eukprot:POR2821..scf208_2
MSVRFCQECNNMMFAREGRSGEKRTLMYSCRTCGTVEEMLQYEVPVYRNVVTKDRSDQTGGVSKGVASDPTLKRVVVPCRDSSCTGSLAVTWLKPVQKNDSKLVTFFSCVKCSFLWSSDDDSAS